jgi:hypothetical protein
LGWGCARREKEAKKKKQKKAPYFEFDFMLPAQQKRGFFWAPGLS